MNGLEYESVQIKARLQCDMVNGRWRYGWRWYLLDTRRGCRNYWCMGIVSDDQHCQVSLVMKFGEERIDGLLAASIDTGSGLVEQKDIR